MTALTSSGQLPPSHHLSTQFTSPTGGIKDSALYREYPSSVYRHGQYHDIPHRARLKSLAKNRVFYMDPADASDADAFDDFYSPIEPEGYIRHRVVPQLEFYQNRCPRVVWACGVFALQRLLTTTHAAGCLHRRPSTSPRKSPCLQPPQARIITQRFIPHTPKQFLRPHPSRPLQPHPFSRSSLSPTTSAS